MEELPRQYRDIATAWWRQGKLLAGQEIGEEERRRLERESERLGRSLESLGLEVRDYTGRPYGNLNVEAIAIEPDPSVTAEVIFETVSPELVWQGSVVQRSRVVVHKPGAAPASEPVASEPLGAVQVAAGPEACDVEGESREADVRGEDGRVAGEAGRAGETVASPPARGGLDVSVVVLAALAAVLSLATLVLVLRLGGTVTEEAAELRRAIGGRSEASPTVVVDMPAQEEGVGEAPSSDELSLVEYEVRPGDTLEGICAERGLDYRRYANLICSLNGLSNPDEIQAGQTLVIPSNS